MAESNAVAVKPRDVTPRDYEPRMPPKRSEVIAQRIVRDIGLRGCVAGDALSTEMEMCRAYNVGRSTLREALRFLELQGVIEIRPGRGGGPIVAAPNSRHLASTFALLMQFSETTFRSVMEMRGHLEPIAASLCARHRDDSAILALKLSVERMGADIDVEEAFARENHQFHRSVAEGSGNPLIGYISNSLDWIIDGAPLGVRFTKNDRRAVLKAHDEIYREIEAGRFSEAGAAMRAHIADATKHFEHKFPKVMSRVVSWELYGL